MSSKTRSHDVVCGFREAKVESSGGEGGISPRRHEGCFLKNGKKLRDLGRPIHSVCLRSIKTRQAWFCVSFDLEAFDRPQAKMLEDFLKCRFC